MSNTIFIVIKLLKLIINGNKLCIFYNKKTDKIFLLVSISNQHQRMQHILPFFNVKIQAVNLRVPHFNTPSGPAKTYR